MSAVLLAINMMGSCVRARAWASQSDGTGCNALDARSVLLLEVCTHILISLASISLNSKSKNTYVDAPLVVETKSTSTDLSRSLICEMADPQRRRNRPKKQ